MENSSSSLEDSNAGNDSAVEKMPIMKSFDNHGSFACSTNEQSRPIACMNRSDLLDHYSSGSEVETEPRVRLTERRKSVVQRKPSQKRLVEKDGKRNVRSRHIPRSRYLQDIFTTVVDAKWHWVFLMFSVFYFGSWLLFGVCWWLIILSRGEAGAIKCFDNVSDFTEAFLLSVETQMTIGYGGRQVTGKCSEATLLLLVQSAVGMMIDAVMWGLIFAKIARPGKRQTTILFSQNAIITKRDNKMCLMFQMADVRKRQLSECVIRLHLFRTYITKEGKIIRNHQDQLRVGLDWVNLRDDSERVFLLFPGTMCHVIDRKSPLYNMTPEKLRRSDWEFVAIFEGTVEATGCTTQARTSYLASEISWGYDFIDISVESDWHEELGILYRMKRMNKMVPAPYVPVCSAKEYYLRTREVEDVLDEKDELWDDKNFLKPEAVDSTFQI